MVRTSQDREVKVNGIASTSHHLPPSLPNDDEDLDPVAPPRKNRKSTRKNDEVPPVPPKTKKKLQKAVSWNDVFSMETDKAFTPEKKGHTLAGTRHQHPPLKKVSSMATLPTVGNWNSSTIGSHTTAPSSPEISAPQPITPGSAFSLRRKRAFRKKSSTSVEYYSSQVSM